jgi:hypothetical protein
MQGSKQVAALPDNDIYSERELIRQSFLRESAYFTVSSPLFSALGRACADDDDILQLCLATRRGQSAGVLLLFVAQYLLLKEPDPALARFFSSMTAEPAPIEDAFPVFREFCLDRRAAVTELLAWRTVNTNLIEKSSTLLPAIHHVANIAGKPLTLLEICCSSGMNLLFDQYHYDYGSMGTVGNEGSPVQLNCKVIGSRKPPIEAIPQIVEKVGVDLVTIDIHDPMERLWMEAVLCPEWKSERKNLEAALQLRVATQLRTIQADALEVLPSLLDQLPGALCILQTYCMGHWSAEAKADLEELLLKASRQRDIHRIGLEMFPGESAPLARDRLTKLAGAGISIFQKSCPSPIEHKWYAGGALATRVLGQGDGFGVWLDWQT